MGRAYMSEISRNQPSLMVGWVISVILKEGDVVCRRGAWMAGCESSLERE
jgi:hypothetical protein